MDLFFWLIVVGVVLSILGSVIWWVFIYFVINSAARLVTREIEAQMTELELLIQQVGAAAARHSIQVEPSMQARIIQLLSQSQNRMSQLDDVSRMRYESRVGELMGMASEVGIDWHPENC